MSNPTTQPELTITLTMKRGMWSYEVRDAASDFGGKFGFVSPERAFAAALDDMERGISRGGGFDTGTGAWVEPWGEIDSGR